METIRPGDKIMGFSESATDHTNYHAEGALWLYELVIHENPFYIIPKWMLTGKP